MSASPLTRSLIFTLAAPAAALLPAVLPADSRGLTPLEASELHGRFDPSLGELRAGSAQAPRPLLGSERSELAAAQSRASGLDALRGGDGPSDHEWTWLLIGAGVVLLIVLL